MKMQSQTTLNEISSAPLIGIAVLVWISHLVARIAFPLSEYRQFRVKKDFALAMAENLVLGNRVFRLESFGRSAKTPTIYQRGAKR